MNYDQEVPFGVVLHPSDKEFKDFKSYVYSVIESPKYRDLGCVKVPSLDRPPGLLQV
jgi:hypothetical protein